LNPSSDIFLTVAVYSWPVLGLVGGCVGPAGPDLGRPTGWEGGSGSRWEWERAGAKGWWRRRWWLVRWPLFASHSVILVTVAGAHLLNFGVDCMSGWPRRPRAVVLDGVRGGFASGSFVSGLAVGGGGWWVGHIRLTLSDFGEWIWCTSGQFFGLVECCVGPRPQSRRSRRGAKGFGGE
jgi:hypothetical protein